MKDIKKTIRKILGIAGCVYVGYSCGNTMISSINSCRKKLIKRKGEKLISSVISDECEYNKGEITTIFTFDPMISIYALIGKMNIIGNCKRILVVLSEESFNKNLEYFGRIPNKHAIFKFEDKKNINVELHIYKYIENESDNLVKLLMEKDFNYDGIILDDCNFLFLEIEAITKVDSSIFAVRSIDIADIKYVKRKTKAKYIDAAEIAENMYNDAVVMSSDHFILD